MQKIVKWIFISLAVIFVLIQFLPKGLPENHAETSNDLLSVYAVPEEVAGILKNSCYNCHSNNTDYPWYSYVTPVNYLIAHDVAEGREELNFSEWGQYDRKKQIKKLNEIPEEIEEGEMPLPIYTTIHGDAVVSEEQLTLLSAWAETLTEEILNPPLEANQ